MERSQFWTLIGLGVACGIFLEVIKAPSTQPIRLAGFTKFETLLDDGRQIYVPTEEIPAKKPQKAAPEPSVIVAQNEAPAATAEGEVKPESEADAAKKKAEEEKKKADEKKKKDDEAKKKKKKKKKKAADATAGSDENQQPPVDDDNEKKKGFSDDDVASGGGGGSYLGAPTANPDRLPVTVLEWEAYLMKDADLDRLSKFINAYQTGHVKSDVFYPVVEAMLEDSRPRIRSLAVVALGAAPSLKSFGMLVGVEHNDAAKEVKAQAEATLKSYARLENLRHLLIVISAGDPATTTEAINLVRLSAASHLKNTAPTSQVVGQTNVRKSGTPVAYFVQLLGPLQMASQKNGDSNVRLMAGQTFNELQNLMGASRPPSTALTVQQPVALQQAPQ